MPLIGATREERVIEATDRLLRAISEGRVRDVILDLTGIEAADTGAVDHLLRIVGAVRLLGARATVTGISPSLAQAISAPGAGLAGVRTMRTLREALRAVGRRGAPMT
jgi:rsbT co-antagonist protein RsbR